MFQAKLWELPFEKIYLQGNYVQPEFELYLQSWNFLQNLFLQIDSMMYIYKNLFRTFFITLCICTVKFDIKNHYRVKKWLRIPIYIRLLLPTFTLSIILSKKKEATNTLQIQPLLNPWSSKLNSTNPDRTNRTSN